MGAVEGDYWVERQSQMLELGVLAASVSVVLVLVAPSVNLERKPQGN